MTVASQIHAAALRDALRAPTEFETILRVLECPEIGASTRDRDPLVVARLRRIESMRRILAGEGGTLSAEKVGEVLTISRQAVEKRRKSGRLIGISLGRRGFGYPAWQFTTRGILPSLESVLSILKAHDPWTKLVFFLTDNPALGGRKPIDDIRSGQVEGVIAAARLVESNSHGFGDRE